MVLPRDFVCKDLKAELVSVGDLILDGDLNFLEDWTLLSSRIQNQSAVSGITSFSGSLSSPTISTNAISVLSSGTISFNGSVTVGGAFQSVLGSCTMPAYSTAQYIPLKLLAGSSTSGTVAMNWGKDVTTNNSGSLQWDITNSRCVIGLTGNTLSKINISSAAVDFTNGLFTSTGDQFTPYASTTTSTISLTAGQFSTVVQIPNVNKSLRDMVIVLENLTTTVAGLPLQLQFGPNGVFPSAVNSYNGLTEGASRTIWPTANGIYVHDTMDLNTPLTSIIKITYVGDATSGSSWSVSLHTAGTNNNKNSVGHGSIFTGTLGTTTTYMGLRLRCISGSSSCNMTVSYA